MSDKIIAATLKVDTGDSNAEIAEVNKNLEKTSETLNKTNQEGKNSKDTFGNLKNSLSQVPGPLNSVTQGVTTVNTSLKALAANPIILIVTLLVTALVALYKAFASTEEGAEKIEQIFSGIGAAVTVLRDRILKIGAAIIDFFKGNFKEAIQEGKEAVTGVGDAIVTAYNKATDATRRLQDAEDELNRVINIGRAKLNRDLASTKELITDETAGYKDRKKAIEDVREAESKQSKEELDNAYKTFKALQDKLDLDKTSADLKDQVAQQQIKIFGIEEQSAADIRSLNRQSRQIEQQENQKATEAYQKELDKRKQSAANLAAYEQQITKLRQENYINGITDTYEKSLAQLQLNLDNELTAIKKSYTEKHLTQEQAAQLEIETDEKYRLQFLAERDKHDKELADQQEANKKKADEALKKKFADENTAFYKSIEKQTAAYKADQDARNLIDKMALEKKQAILQTTSNLLSSLSNLFGKQTIAGKAFAIAQTTIDTFQSAISSYKSLAGIPVVGPALGFAAAAAAIANGLAAVRDIVKVKVPGAADSTSAPTGSSTSLISPSAPLSPSQQSTTIDQASIAGIGNAVSNRNYVLSQDITHDMDRNERLNKAARLGG